MDNKTEVNEFNIYKFQDFPVVPLRGLIVFPKMDLHFDVGRKKSIAALRQAMNTDQKIFLISQKDACTNDPDIDDLFETGVLCKIRQMIKIPNSNNLRIIVEGLQRGCLVSINDNKQYLSGVVDLLDEVKSEQNVKTSAYCRAVKKEFEEYAYKVNKISNEVINKIISVTDMGELADYVCANTFFDYADKQKILDEYDTEKRVVKLLSLLRNENVTLNIEAEIQRKVQKEIDKSQKEYYLREEMRVIAEELGENDNPVEEADEYRNRISSLKCTDEIKTVLLNECEKLSKMPYGSHEATVVRNYLDRCLEIPFGKYTRDSISLDRSRKALDRDHYGLDKVKDRIIESLAVYKRTPLYSGQIICLYGPPGVGKTSIVKSLAKSMNRKYVRVALGGIHDEAEIRGHRRTYIGAMSGRIVDAIVKSGVMNPVILLDEIDKLGISYNGDPSSALLEALDPEQNSSFTDHYIDFPIDLSKVMFITTANDLSTVSPPLYDRMEVIELNSYTIDEKFNIAKKHLLKKALNKHGISASEFKITDGAIYKIIECYTREAGVRDLEKQLNALCRKAAVQLENSGEIFRVKQTDLHEYLGVEKFDKDIVMQTDSVGTVNGLAWTQVGGTMLPIEVSALSGTGKIELTGNLGDVMKESAKTAVSFVRSKSEQYGICSDFYKTMDIHIHAPESAIPKDGPSAGLAITTALVSELTGIPVKANVAMTGEISLKGNAMRIGGLKEKSMAAYKAGCDTVIIPQGNCRDLEEISDDVKNAVNFVPVKTFDDLLSVALVSKPEKKPHFSKKNNNIAQESAMPQ